MLSQIVGQVDAYSAAVLVALFVTTCVVITTAIAKRRSRQDISNEHELAIVKQNQESERAKYISETTRQVEFKKIEANTTVELAKVRDGLITSHRVEPPRAAAQDHSSD